MPGQSRRLLDRDAVHDGVRVGQPQLDRVDAVLDERHRGVDAVREPSKPCEVGLGLALLVHLRRVFKRAAPFPGGLLALLQGGDRRVGLRIPAG